MATSALPLPPGNPGLPFLGETLTFLKAPSAFFEARFRRHGPIFRTRILGSEVACLVGPEGMKFIYDENLFERATGSPAHFKDIFGERAVVFKDGADHKRTRKLFAHAFSKEALDSYEDAVGRIVARHLDRWSTAGEQRGVDAVGALCFSLANHLFAGVDPEVDDDRLLAVFNTFLGGLFAPPIRLPFTAFGRMLAARKQLAAHVDDAVAAYRPGSTGQHVLRRLFEARDDAGRPMDPEDIRTELLHFFSAAYAGLQASIVDMLLALHENPAVLERARAGDAPYLDAITREVRRLYDIAPSTFFAAAKVDCQFKGYRIPKGWKAVAAIYPVMHDEKVFPEPTRFDPDRFSAERGEMKKDPQTWVPHGGGPVDGHRCAGEQLANRLLNAFLRQAVAGYRWELPPQNLAYAPAGLAQLPVDGLRIVVRRI